MSDDFFEGRNAKGWPRKQKNRDDLGELHLIDPKPKPKFKITDPKLYGVYIPGLGVEENKQVELEVEKEWQVQHAPIDQYRSRFIPKASWNCPTCHRSIKTNPRACQDPAHIAGHNKAHPNARLRN